jgi:hypothetical protein
VANFVKRLNKGTNGRYRGKLPLIFFNCDGIGHFANKCPHKVTQNENTHIKAKELQRNISRKYYASKKTSHHQMKMKSVIVRQEEFYPWQ